MFSKSWFAAIAAVAVVVFVGAQIYEHVTSRIVQVIPPPTITEPVVPKPKPPVKKKKDAKVLPPKIQDRVPQYERRCNILRRCVFVDTETGLVVWEPSYRD